MASPQWLFGPFRLDPDNACLWHDGQAKPLTPKSFSVLQYLVTHADRLITKDELFEALWPDTVVSEAALRICIGGLRKALGEAGGGAAAPSHLYGQPPQSPGRGGAAPPVHCDGTPPRLQVPRPRDPAGPAS